MEGSWRQRAGLPPTGLGDRTENGRAADTGTIHGGSRVSTLVSGFDPRKGRLCFCNLAASAGVPGTPGKFAGAVHAARDGPLRTTRRTRTAGLAPHGAVRSFPEGAVVVNEGDATDSPYVVLSGRVKVFVSGEDGKEVVVGTIDGGDYFGELVLDGSPGSASVMTLEPCRFFLIRATTSEHDGAQSGVPRDLTTTASTWCAVSATRFPTWR